MHALVANLKHANATTSHYTKIQRENPQIRQYEFQFEYHKLAFGSLIGLLNSHFMLHGHGNIEMDTTCGYMTNSLKYTRHACPTRMSDMTRLHDRNVCVTYSVMGSQ